MSYWYVVRSGSVVVRGEGQCVVGSTGAESYARKCYGFVDSLITKCKQFSVISGEIATSSIHIIVLNLAVA